MLKVFNDLRYDALNVFHLGFEPGMLVSPFQKHLKATRKTKRNHEEHEGKEKW